MESSLIVQEKLLNSNKTKLNIDFCQIIVKFESVCFIISQLTKYNSKLKHNYVLLKDHLKELTCIGLLRELENGICSGKNHCILYIKQLPESLSSRTIEQFSLKYLNQMKISWSTYIHSCQKLILPSKFAVLSTEASNILNNHVYNCIVQQHETATTTTLISTNKIKLIKNCTKKSKSNHKITKMPIIEKNQNSILKYFHPSNSTTNDSSKRTNQKFSNISNDYDDSEIIDISSSSSAYQSSNIIKSSTTSNIIRSKYFLDQNYTNTLLVNQNK